MVKVNIREFIHKFSDYAKEVENGEEIIVMKRNIPYLTIKKYNPNKVKPSWKRKINKISLKSGLDLSKDIVKSRGEEKF